MIGHLETKVGYSEEMRSVVDVLSYPDWVGHCDHGNPAMLSTAPPLDFVEEVHFCILGWAPLYIFTLSLDAFRVHPFQLIQPHTLE